MATKKKNYSNVQVARLTIPLVPTGKRKKKKKTEAQTLENVPSFFGNPPFPHDPLSGEIRSAEKLAAKQDKVLGKRERSLLKKNPESRRFFIHGGTEGRDTRPNLTDVEDAADREFAHTFHNIAPSEIGSDTSSRTATTALRSMLEPLLRNSSSAELGWQVITRGTSGKEDIEAIAAIIAYYKRRIGGRIEKNEAVTDWRYPRKDAEGYLRHEGDLKADVEKAGIEIEGIPKGSKPEYLDKHYKWGTPLIKEHHKQMQTFEILASGEKKWSTKRGFPGGEYSVAYLEGTDFIAEHDFKYKHRENLPKEMTTTLGVGGLYEWLRGGGLAALRHELQHVGDDFLKNKYEDAYPFIQDKDAPLLHSQIPYNYLGQGIFDKYHPEYKYRVGERIAHVGDVKAHYATKDDPNNLKDIPFRVSKRIAQRELRDPAFLEKLGTRDDLAVQALEDDFGIYGWNLPYRKKQRKKDAEAISKGIKKDAVSNMIQEYEDLTSTSRFLDPSKIVMNTGEWDARLNRPVSGSMPVDVMEGTEQNPLLAPMKWDKNKKKYVVPYHHKTVGTTMDQWGNPQGLKNPEPIYRSFPRQPGEVQMKRRPYSSGPYGRYPAGLKEYGDMMYNEGGTVKKRKKVKRNKVQKKQYSSGGRVAKYKG